MNKKLFAQKLYILRKREQYTQQDIADKLHIDRSTFSYYETGKSLPSYETLIKIAEIFSVPIEYLIK